MKKWKILVCVVLCLAIIAGAAVYFLREPAAQVSPEAKKLDGRLVLSDLNLNLNGEEITLPQELRLSLTEADDAARMHFEIGSEGSALLPVSGEIDETGLRFRLGDSKNIYSIDAAMLQNLMGVDGESQAAFEAGFQLGESGADMLNLPKDKKTMAQLQKLEEQVLATLLGEPAEKGSVEINGKKKTTSVYKGSVSLEDFFAALDVILDSEIEAVSSYGRMILDLVNVGLETSFEHFSDLTGLMKDIGMTEQEISELAADVEAEVFRKKDSMYGRVVVDLPVADEGKNLVICEVVADSNGIDMTLDLDMESASDTLGYSSKDLMGFEFSMDMKKGEVIAFNAQADATGKFSIGSDGEMSGSDSRFIANISGAQEKGLWNATLNVDYTDDYSYTVDGETETYSDGFAFNGSYAQSEDANGVRNTVVSLNDMNEENPVRLNYNQASSGADHAIALDLAYGEENYGLSFNANLTEGANLAALPAEGENVLALTENAEDEVYVQLESDALGLVDDLIALSSDENIMRLMEIGSEMMMDSMMDYGGDQYDVDGGYEYAAETVYSLEEAAAIYGGTMPTFTAPEGFELAFVEVTETDLYAEYASNDSYLAYYLIDLGGEEGFIGEEIQYYNDESGNVVIAEFDMNDTYVCFYLNSLPQADAEAIIAGFSL